MNFCVVGAGAWGTAFALHLARGGHTVSLVPRRAEHATALRQTRSNPDYLPGVELTDGVEISSDLANSAKRAEVIVFACPSQALRDTCTRIRQESHSGQAGAFVISLSKGLEVGTHLRPTQVIASVLPGLQAGALAGPTNAAEFARGLPAAMVLAAREPGAVLPGLQAAMSGPSLRIYTSDDVTGVEYGSCLKNIYAIAAGCCDGLRLGDNARAALLTRALAEMVRVGVELGARAETFYGLSGFGDLVATCHGSWSRNREFGELIGRGQDAAALVADRRTLVEGYRTTESFAGLCAEKKIEAPILSEMHAILFAGKKPASALAALMSRELKRESANPLARAESGTRS